MKKEKAPRKFGKRGKIKKFGKLIIEEGHLTFTGFHTKYDSLLEFQKEVLGWARRRIEEEIDKVEPLTVISIEL